MQIAWKCTKSEKYIHVICAIVCERVKKHMIIYLEHLHAPPRANKEYWDCLRLSCHLSEVDFYLEIQYI